VNLSSSIPLADRKHALQIDVKRSTSVPEGRKNARSQKQTDTTP